MLKSTRLPSMGQRRNLGMLITVLRIHRGRTHYPIRLIFYVTCSTQPNAYNGSSLT
jgi:hypothetical protein